MTVEEVRNHKEYFLVMEKIRSYPKGFEFTLNYARIPTPKCNALKIIMEDAIQNGLLESVALGVSIEGKFVDETFRRI